MINELILRLEQANDRLLVAGATASGSRHDHLLSKAEGVRLALGYVREMFDQPLDDASSV